MATACDSDSLLELAKCFRCTDPGNLPDLSLALACVVAGGAPPTPAPPVETGIMLGNPDTDIVFGDPVSGNVFGTP